MAMIPLASPPPGARAFLAGLELLRDLAPGVLDLVESRVEWVRAEGGEQIFEAGEAGDGVYFVHSGRLQVLGAATADGGPPLVIAELGAGEPVGELALLTGKPRSATVRAVRDSELCRFSRVTFEELLDAHPRALLPLATAVAERLRRRDDAPDRRISTVALVPLGPGVDLTGFARALVERLGAVGGEPILRVTPELGERLTASWLHEREVEHRLTVFEVPLAGGSWEERCLRQADRIIVVASGSEDPSRLEGPRALAAADPDGSRRRVELVLLHAPGASPNKTIRWLRLLPFAAHFHLREGDANDLGRLARHLLGRSVGLVLGGGGTAAFCHIGVLRALHAAGVPVDRVGGASFGGILGAQIAAGWSPEKLLEVNGREFQRTRIDRAATLPVISLTHLDRAWRMHERMFGDAGLEDLWLPFFCVTTDLTHARLAVHRRGPAVQWVTATAAPPALQPPVLDDGVLHVDGGCLNNLPVDVMRAEGPGPIIAVCASPFDELRVDPAVHPQAPSAWRYLTRRMWSGPARFPSIIDLIHRTAKVTSLQIELANCTRSDLYLEPPVTEIGLTDYWKIERADEIGFEYTRDRLAEQAEQVRSWLEARPPARASRVATG